jgi:hypothetical protein
MVANNNICFKFPLILFLILTSILISSCEIFLNEAAECIVKVKPNLPVNNLATGKLGIEYYDSITASAKNHVNDDDFAYYFDMVGRPPRGINFYTDNRIIYFTGTPTEKGTFSFIIKLTIGAGTILEDDGVCITTDDTSRKYVITIE